MPPLQMSLHSPSAREWEWEERESPGREGKKGKTGRKERSDERRGGWVSLGGVGWGGVGSECGMRV